MSVTPLLTQTEHPFPSQAPKPITVLSDTAVVKREGSSVFPRTLLLLFWFQPIPRLKGTRLHVMFPLFRAEFSGEDVSSSLFKQFKAAGIQ